MHTREKNNKEEIYWRISGAGDKCTTITGERTGKTALFAREQNVAIKVGYYLVNRTGFIFNYTDHYIYQLNRALGARGVSTGDWKRRTEPPEYVSIRGGQKTSIHVTINFDKGVHNIAKTSRALSVDEIDRLVKAVR